MRKNWLLLGVQGRCGSLELLHLISLNGVLLLLLLLKEGDHPIGLYTSTSIQTLVDISLSLSLSCLNLILV